MGSGIKTRMEIGLELLCRGGRISTVLKLNNIAVANVRAQWQSK